GAGFLALVTTAALLLGAGEAPAASPARAQSRPHGARVAVEPSGIRVMDGDTMEISWASAQRETVRVLGIDAPELFTRRDGGEPTVPGFEARGFARGAFAVAQRVELLRAAILDRYGRSLGYFFLDGRNYSVMAIEKGFAEETISRFGDNGFPK